LVPILFVARGYRTGDFYRYTPSGDTGLWQALAPIPPGERGRMPGKGAAAACDEARYVYATRGNNTLDFLGYDIEADSWFPLPSVPAGAENSMVKAGADLVYFERHDSGFVYLLKGGGNEFYRYAIEQRKWDTVPSAPWVVRPRWAQGSFLVSDGAGFVYAHQARYEDGASHYMFRFDALADTWHRPRLAGMPVSGMHGGTARRKRSRGGGCGAWLDTGIYALKGGNTQQFFRYFPAGDYWLELDTMPGLGATGRRKLVKAGADIVALGDDFFYALKGNKTDEFWRYVAPAAGGKRQTGHGKQSGTQEGKFAVPSLQFAVSPNPTNGGLVTVWLTGLGHNPESEKDLGYVPRLRVFDAAGRCVLARTFVIGNSSFVIPLDCRGLASGVFLVRVDAVGRTATYKLVVQARKTGD